MRFRRIIVVIAGSVAVGASAFHATPAVASWSECSNGYACLWGNRNYSDAPWFEKKATGNYNTGYWDNDETSSVANRSAVSSVNLYNHTNTDSSGGVVCLPREYAARDLNETSPEFDDRISSVKIYSGACLSNISQIGYKKLS